MRVDVITRRTTSFARFQLGTRRAQRFGMRHLIHSLTLAALSLSIGSAGCADIDPDDDDPTAIADEEIVASDSTCREAPRHLTTRSHKLTLVLHVANDRDFVDLLGRHAAQLRQRDVLMVNAGVGAGFVAHVREVFPCNRIVAIAGGPDEIETALALPDTVEGIVVDHEPGVTPGFDSRFEPNVDRVANWVRRIENHHRRAGLATFDWVSAPNHWDYGALARRTGLDLQIVQTQPFCDPDAHASESYPSVSSDLRRDYVNHNLDPRDVGVEVSIGPGEHQQWHVSPDRAAACTEATVRAGVSTVLVWGGHRNVDGFRQYLRRLDASGLRPTLASTP